MKEGWRRWCLAWSMWWYALRTGEKPVRVKVVKEIERVVEKETIYLPVMETEVVPEPVREVTYAPPRRREVREEMPVRVKLDPASRIKL